MAISSPGIGSNLDVASIVNKLMQVEAQPLATLAAKEAGVQAKLSAFGTLSGALGGFQTAMNALATPSRFQAVAATSSDPAVLSASAANGAASGNYNVNVTQLAQAQTIATAGQSSTTAAIGAGTSTTINFQFGTITGGSLANGAYTGASFAQDPAKASGSITIDATNNSLQGIRDAINKAGLGVTATIVSDGSATPHRLVLTSTKTGASSSMKLTVNGDSDVANLLAYDAANDSGQKLNQAAAAQNTLMTVNGIAVSSATNSIAEAVQGLTMTVSKTGTSVVAVARDTAGVQSAMGNFVKAYNDFNKTVKTLTAYDPSTKKGGLLLGDAATRQIQSQLRSMLSGAVTGPDGSFATIAQAGLSIGKDGSMALDTSKLNAALASSPEQVAGLFATMGSTSDSLATYIGSSTASQPGKNTINVSSLATRGKTTGSAPADLTITQGLNDELSITVDGAAASVKLLPGTYTAAALAAQLQSAINGASAYASGAISVAVTESAGVLTITSNRYGSSSNVSASGSALATLLGSSPSITAGSDIAGTMGGFGATGSGQVLTGAGGGPADGIKVQISGGVTGERGSVTFSQGLAHRVGKLIEGYLGSSGTIASRTTGLNSSIKDIGKSREALNMRLAAMEKRYLAQFTALDTAISGMKQTSSYLTQQLDQLSAMTKSS